MAMAKHEQGEVLQGLIYDDPEFTDELALQRNMNDSLLGGLVPDLVLHFTADKTTNDPALINKAPKGLVLEDYNQRMKWIKNTANQFHLLMDTRTKYMFGELRTIASWRDLRDPLPWFEQLKSIKSAIL